MNRIDNRISITNIVSVPIINVHNACNKLNQYAKSSVQNYSTPV